MRNNTLIQIGIGFCFFQGNSAFLTSISELLLELEIHRLSFLWFSIRAESQLFLIDRMVQAVNDHS